MAYKQVINRFVIVFTLVANISFLELGMHFWRGLNAFEGTERELGSTLPTILAGLCPPEMTEARSFVDMTVTATTQVFKNQQAARKVV